MGAKCSYHDVFEPGCEDLKRCDSSSKIRSNDAIVEVSATKEDSFTSRTDDSLDNKKIKSKLESSSTHSANLAFELPESSKREIT